MTPPRAHMPWHLRDPHTRYRGRQCACCGRLIAVRPEAPAPWVCLYCALDADWIPEREREP